MAKSSSEGRNNWSTLAWQWIDERLGIGNIMDAMRNKHVPIHKHTGWYFWGGLTLFFFGVQVITGILLLMYYRSGDQAYESVHKIVYDIDFGWLIRSVHSWAANLMIGSAFIHMFSKFFMKAYRSPREFGWWTGIAMLGMAFTFGFSGYLLPFDELAYFATKVGLDIPATVPIIGPVIADIARGGPEVTVYTIQRFLALHVVLLPMLFLPILLIHVLLIFKHGSATIPSELDKPESERKSMPFYPDFMSRDFALWMAVLALLIALAAMFPWQLGQPADALKPAPEGIHPEWYFMSQFFIFKLFGALIPGVIGELLSILLFTAAGLLWVVIPFLDNNRKDNRRSKAITWLGIIALVSLVLSTFLAYIY